MEKINTCYVHTLYTRIKENINNTKCIDALVDYYVRFFPIHYYEVVEINEYNIEQMYLTLYHLDYEQ